MSYSFSRLGIGLEWWGRPPGCEAQCLRGSPWTRRSPTNSALSKQSKPTRASAAVRGDRPTLMQIAQDRENYVTLRTLASRVATRGDAQAVHNCAYSGRKEEPESRFALTTM